MKKYLTLFLCLLVLLPLSLWAKDFGLVLDQTPGFGGAGKNAAVDYTGLVIPRFSTLLGDSGELYISAAFRADYLSSEWAVVPELLRTEFSWNFGRADLRAGRMEYSDPLGFIANGLFDGARVSVDTDAGAFSVGAWYTGLLFNKTTIITMTTKELGVYNGNTEYGDFVNTYFAPRRIVAALDWDPPSVGDLVRFNFGLLGQFDVSGADLHSQYLTGKASVPVSDFVFSLGGCLELIENKAEDEVGLGLAGEAEIAWMLPTPIEDRLSLLGRFSSGVAGSHIDAFQPLTTMFQGDVLKARLSGISMLSLDYIARINKSFSAGITSSYFIRSDLATFYVYGMDGYFLGNEFYARLLWSPVPDIQFKLGGGMFLPSLGNAAPDADILWRIELNVVLSLY